MCCAPKPPLCKGRWAARRRLGGIVQQAPAYSHRFPANSQHCTASIPQSASLTAPFTQGSLGALPRQCICPTNWNLTGRNRPLPLPLGEVAERSAEVPLGCNHWYVDSLRGQLPRGEGYRPTTSTVPLVGAIHESPARRSRETDCHCEEAAESGRRGNLSGGHST